MCHFTPDGKEVIVSHGPDNLVFWDLEADREKRTVAVGVPALTRCAHVRPSGGERGTGFQGRKTGKTTGRLDVNTVSHGIAFAPDNKTIAIINGNKDIQVRDFPGGGLRVSFPLPASAKYQASGRDFWDYRIRFSDDGKTLLLATHGGIAHLWDLASRKQLPQLKGHAGAVTGVHLHPNKKTVITTGEKGLIRRWDAATGREMSAPEGYCGWLHAAYSPDGKLAAVGDRRGRVELWDARRGQVVHFLQDAGPLVANLAFTPCGKALAAALADNTVRFWTVCNSRCRRGQQVHRKRCCQRAVVGAYCHHLLNRGIMPLCLFFLVVLDLGPLLAMTIPAIGSLRVQKSCCMFTTM